MRKDLSPKERVLGLEVKNETRAYPIAKLQKRPGIIEDSLGGETVRIEVSYDGEVVSVRDRRGDEIPHIFAYWFAWQAFHPDTAVYRGSR